MEYFEIMMGEALEETAYRDILVVAWLEKGEPVPAALEALGKARELADSLGAYVKAVTFAAEEEEARKLIGYGADYVYILQNPALSQYDLEIYAKALGDFIQEQKPEIVLFPAIAPARELAPYLAQKLGAGLIANCAEISLDEATRTVIGAHPMYGGEYFRLLANPGLKPQIVTLLPGYFRPAYYDSYRTGEVQTVPVEPVSSRVKVKGPVDFTIPKGLNKAKVVVSVGRGVKGEEEMELVKKLAQALNAELAGSRGAVDEGLIEPDRQVGMSGHQIEPKLYVACGISGAIQHYYGIRNARCIVAINSDPTAPIFKVADLGLVGEVKEIIPAVLKELGAR